MKQKIFTFLVVLTIIAMLPGSALAAQPARTTLHGSAPAWANSKNYAGAADPNAYVGFRVYLGWQNAGAAEALARAVSDPHSAQYGQYLTLSSSAGSSHPLSLKWALCNPGARVRVFR